MAEYNFSKNAMIITVVPISSLKTDDELSELYPRDPDTIKVIKNTIMKLGQIEEIITDSKLRIIAGYSRYYALLDLVSEGKVPDSVRIKKLIDLDIDRDIDRKIAKSIAIVDNVARRPLTKQEIIESIEKLSVLWGELSKDPKTAKIVEEQKDKVSVEAEKAGVDVNRVLRIIDRYKHEYPEFFKMLKKRGITSPDHASKIMHLVNEKLWTELNEKEWDFIASNYNTLEKKKKELEKIDDKEELIQKIHEILENKEKAKIQNKVEQINTTRAKINEVKENKEEEITDEKIRSLINIKALREFVEEIVKEANSGEKPVINAKLYEALKDVLKLYNIDESKLTIYLEKVPAI